MLVSLLCVLGAATVSARSDAVIGKGQWIVEGVSECPDPENQYGLELKRRKMNRTHDGFTAIMNIAKEINEYSHGAYVEVCKKVDGGCKLQHTFNEASFCKFMKQYAEDNFHAALSKAGMMTPDCPIPQGEMVIKDYVFNYKELPEDGMFGEFTAKAFLTEGEKRVSCISVDLKFKESDDDDNCEK